MTALSTHSVVDRMVAQLAERRRTRAAYLALAQAILSDDQADVSPALERQPNAIGSQVAA
jgi:hypothetical protein